MIQYDASTAQPESLNRSLKVKTSQTTKTKRHEYHNSQPATLDTLSCWLNSVIVFTPRSPCCHRKDPR